MEKFRGGAKSFLLTKHSVRYTIVNNKCIPDERMITYGKDSLVECRMGDYELSVEQTESKNQRNCYCVK